VKTYKWRAQNLTILFHQTILKETLDAYSHPAQTAKIDPENKDMMMEDCYQHGDESQCETCADDSDSNNNNNNNNNNSNSNVGGVDNQNYISLDVVRERLLRNNESYLIQCGEYKYSAQRGYNTCRVAGV